jgi:peptidoglycan/xylan/chitin deacetylase (PgdA/CDA1 family)
MIQDFLARVHRRAALIRTKPFRMQNRAPVVSFTFDDVPESAFINGVPILEERGIYGTFYIASGTCDSIDFDTHWHLLSVDQVSLLHERGHEIGCHTFSHVNIETLSAAGLDEECRKNHNLLRRICGDIQLTNFCYPFGRVNLLRKLQLQKRFDTCRGVSEGVNFGTIDLGLLKIIGLYNQTLTPERLQRVLSETCDRNGWLIFCMHDVVDSPSWIGGSPDLLRSTIERVQAMGLSCVPVRDALKHIGYTTG